MPVHQCSSIVDLWPCHTLTGVGPRPKRHFHSKAESRHEMQIAVASEACIDLGPMILRVGRSHEFVIPGKLYLKMGLDGRGLTNRERSLLYMHVQYCFSWKKRPRLDGQSVD
jgi:hypothetical protein